MPILTATLKFFDLEKGHGYASTAAGDVRINANIILAAQLPNLLPGAELTLDVLRGQTGLQAQSITSITPPPFKEGTIKWFDEAKAFGFIASEDGDVFLHYSVTEVAGVLPWKGLPVHFWASPGKDGKPNATKVVYPTLAEEIAAMAAEVAAAPAETLADAATPLSPYVVGEVLEASVKWFKADKGYGYLIVEGKQGDLFFHISQVRKGLELPDGLAVVCVVGENPKGHCALQVRLPGEDTEISELFKQSPPVAVEVKPRSRTFTKPKSVEADAGLVDPAPTVTRRPRKGKVAAPTGPVVDTEHPLEVTELPDGPLAAGLARLGLVAVTAKANGLDHSPAAEGQPTH